MKSIARRRFKENEVNVWVCPRPTGLDPHL